MLGISWAAWTETPQPWMLRMEKTQCASHFLRWCLVSHVLPAQIKEARHKKIRKAVPNTLKSTIVYTGSGWEWMGRLDVRGSWLHLHCCLLRGVHLCGGSVEWTEVWALFCYYMSLVWLPHRDFFHDFQYVQCCFLNCCRSIVYMIRMIPTFWGHPAAQMQRKACLFTVVQAGRRLRWFMVCRWVSQSNPSKGPFDATFCLEKGVNPPEEPFPKFPSLPVLKNRYLGKKDVQYRSRHLQCI